MAKDGYTYKYDISLPQEKFYDVVEVMRTRLSGMPVHRVAGYGHIGKVLPGSFVKYFFAVLINVVL